MAIDIGKILPITSTVDDTSTSGIDLVGTLLTSNVLIPYNATQKLLSFKSAQLVGDFFGLTSEEYLFAVKYFLAWDNSTIKPKFLNCARYVDANAQAYTRGGIVGIDQLAALQAVTAGILELHFNGATQNLTGIDLSTATSLSDVASLIETKIQAGTLTAGTCTYSSLTKAFTISDGLTAGTSTVGFTIDATGTGLGTLLALTESKGAVLSQGSIVLTPTETMEGILTVTRNWVSFTTLENLSGEVGYTRAIAFAKWANDKSNRYAYMAWSSETNLIIPGNTSDMFTTIATYDYASVVPLYNKVDHAAFFMGLGAATDYTAINGTISFASKTQAGLPVSADTDSAFDALIAKGVNFYANFTSANDSFRFSENGKITGIFKWVDNFNNQVWLADQVQINEASLLNAVNKLDYGTEGQQLLTATLVTVMKKALINGVSQVGNVFDDAQKAILKQQAGVSIDSNLSDFGYYIQITPPSPSLKANRPSMKSRIWYTNNGSFYSIDNNLTFVN